LNAPTTAVKGLGDQLTSHVDQDTVYHVSILDRSPVRDEAHQYHSVVRVCLDDGPQESYPHQQTTSGKSANFDICTIEYAPFPQNSGGGTQILPTLHSSLEKSFSVTWSSSSVTGGSYCLIPIKFRNFTGPGDVALKLFVGTERIQMIDATLSHAEQYEESYGCVRLFSGGGAQETRAAETTDIEHQIITLQRAIEQAKIAPVKADLAQASEHSIVDHHIASERHTTRKRKASTDAKLAFPCTKEHISLINRLSAATKRLSAIRPVQVFRPILSAQGEKPQFHMPSQQTKHSNNSAQINKKGKESKRTKTPPTPTHKKDVKGKAPVSHDSTRASSKEPIETADHQRRKRPTPGKPFSVEYVFLC
jgi:hypothetical protein